jgi:UDP:flavonoid glycosyltransferase YjiC (YdhE family)
VSPRRLTAEALRDAVRTVLREPSYRAAARRLADKLAAAPGPERAAALLEELTPTATPIVAGTLDRGAR